MSIILVITVIILLLKIVIQYVRSKQISMMGKKASLQTSH